MNCPVCKDVTLSISTREGIEIDHCPQCRGVWLDRGELDKIIERSAQFTQSAAERQPYQTAPVSPPEQQRGWRSPDDYRHKRKKKRSFLDDIFDFD